ncbi:hypothetical protein PL75_01665 [Neisseria arctica]|uniref:Uncharacterized protein n=2 Tax=Neisseria arctica TaxID=1470200 RepID=A0A0J1C5P6_9NEIS|nr:hypothetical protein PL75_01665 [Neisseria arctica]
MGHMQDNNLSIQSIKNKKIQFFIEELVAFGMQTLILFVVIVLISNFFQNSTELIKFSESKFVSIREFFLTLLGTIFAIGILTTIQRLVDDRSNFLSKIIDNTLLEFPRIIYLFGSTLVAVTASIGIYLLIEPDGVNNPTFFIGHSLLFAVSFFVYGIAIKYLLIKKVFKEAILF